MKKKTKREIREEWLYNLLCTATYNGGWCRIDNTNEEDYNNAKGECVEDKWMDILRNGKTLTIHDIYGDEDDEEEVYKMFNLEQFLDAFDIYEVECPHCYADLLIENADFWTAYNYFQVVFFGEVVYG